MDLIPLSGQASAASGFTHRARITHEDLTELEANVAQNLRFAAAPFSLQVWRVMSIVREPFEDTGDAAFNTTEMLLGYTGGPGDFQSNDHQVNGNSGLFMLVGAAGGELPLVFPVTLAGGLIAQFQSMEGKALASLNRGIVDIFLDMARLDEVD